MMFTYRLTYKTYSSKDGAEQYVAIVMAGNSMVHAIEKANNIPDIANNQNRYKLVKVELL